jgi:hypothetical protein
LDIASLPLEHIVKGALESLVTCSSSRLLRAGGQSLPKQTLHVGVSSEYEVASEVDCSSYIVLIRIVFFSPSPIVVSSAVIGERGHIGMRRNETKKGAPHPIEDSQPV